MRLLHKAIRRPVVPGRRIFVTETIIYKMQSEIPYLGALELKLQFVRNQGDELRIGGLALGIADGVAEEPLQN